MGAEATNLGRRALLTVLGTMVMMVGPAPAAVAHGDHGTVPAALFEAAGPYVVSVWIDQTADRHLTVNAVIDGRGSGAPPRLWLDAASGKRELAGLVDHEDGTWTVSFDSMAGDSLVVGWTTALGYQDLAFTLVPLPAPPWFRRILVGVTPIGLWFVNWLMKRRRRAFGLFPAPG